MDILPFISTVFIIISAVLVVIGWYWIKKGEKEKHKRTMLAATVFAVLFFIIYLSRTAFIGNTSFGGPAHIKIYYTIFLIFHITLSTTAAVLGVFTVYTGLKDRLVRHKKIAPLTAIIWLFSALTGVMVYLILYVFYSGGETTSLLKAILGI